MYHVDGRQGRLCDGQTAALGGAAAAAAAPAPFTLSSPASSPAAPTWPTAPGAPPPAALVACAPRGAGGRAGAARRLRSEGAGRGRLDAVQSTPALPAGSNEQPQFLPSRQAGGQSASTYARSRITMSSWPFSSWISCWYRAIRLDWSMISLRATLTSMRLALRSGRGARAGSADAACSAGGRERATATAAAALGHHHAPAIPTHQLPARPPAPPRTGWQTLACCESPRPGWRRG